MSNNIKICIIGLGYVGLPLALEFSKKFKTYGFDKSIERINQLKKRIDKNNLLDKSEIKNLKKISFEDDLKILNTIDIIIVCLPTPVKRNKKPDLKLLISASKKIGTYIKKNTTVIFESTVYPGVTEEICVPIIEKSSGLTWKKDFYVGYSPERISPGRNYKKLSNIKKIISGDTVRTVKILEKIYSKIIKAGLFVAKNIKVAEAAKILENTQRDVNIALMNEVSMIFDKLNINTRDVIKAASTKWNFGLYYPGLVGGHCIGVDPYYLSHKSHLIGEKSDLILTSRKINEQMTSHIFNKIKMKKIKSILILGVTYKEDCNDLRNSKILDLIKILIKEKYKIQISDDIADPKEFKDLTGLNLNKINQIKRKFDLVILSQPHNYFKNKVNKITNLVNKRGYFFDLKSYIPKNKKKRNFWEL